MPSDHDIDAAGELVRATLPETPTVVSAPLSNRWNREIYLKLENTSQIRSFKARGAVVAVARLPVQERQRGVVTASTGNHGQGLALSATLFNTRAVVIAPAGTDTRKLAAMRSLGAEVHIIGDTLADSQGEARRMAARRGLVYLEDGEDADVMAGAATVAAEMIRAQPELDSIVVPVGGGNLVAGALLAANRHPHINVIGVQSVAAPGTTLSWLTGTMTAVRPRTFAGGLAADAPGTHALAVLRAHLRQMAVVEDGDLWSAIALASESTGQAIEGAAAAPIAAMELFGPRIPGDRIGLVLSGGWISAEELQFAADR